MSDDEKSHYTYDEMMDRLKGSQGGSGRRRRSRQHVSDKRKTSKLITLILAAILLPAIILVVCGFLLTVLHYRSDGFKVDMDNLTSNYLGENVRAEFENFEISGLRVNNKNLELTGKSKSYLSNGNLQAIKVELHPSSYFSDEWSIKSLVAESANFLLKSPTPAMNKTSKTTAFPDFHYLYSGFSIGGKTPTSLDIPLFKANAFNLAWGSRETQVNGIKDSSLLLTKATNNYQAEAKGGLLAYHNWPIFSINEINGQLEKDTIRILNSDMSLEGGGSLKMAGKIDFKEGQNADLTGSLAGIPLKQIATADWEKHLGGEIDGAFELTADLRLPGSGAIRGSFSSANAVIKNIPLLETLSSQAGMAALSLIDFSSFKGSFIYTPEKIILHSLEGTKTATFKLRGECTILRNGKMKGTIEIGLPDAILDRFEEVPDYYVAEDDGFRWTKVKLGGTLAKPKDDLTIRFTRNIQQQMTRDSTGIKIPPREDRLGNENGMLEKLFNNLVE